MTRWFNEYGKCVVYAMDYVSYFTICQKPKERNNIYYYYQTIGKANKYITIEKYTN